MESMFYPALYSISKNPVDKQKKKGIYYAKYAYTVLFGKLKNKTGYSIGFWANNDPISDTEVTAFSPVGSSRDCHSGSRLVQV